MSKRESWHLLATKFFVPASPHALIPRLHLDSLLQEGLRRQLSLVSAPAGFGKTTLLAHWVHSLPQETLENHRVAWVSLDEADKCPVKFWTYVLTALDRSESGVATPALQLLQAPHVPALEQVLTALINVLSQTTHSYVLILDDYYLVDNAALHASLNYLVEHQPPQLHLIILTRTDPLLNLPRLRVRGQLLEIRTEQLRCTTEEATAFLQEVMGIELPPEALHEMIARTEGWLAGLQLLGLSLQARSDPQDLLQLLSGTHHYILDYLTEEVLRQQPPAVQRFLLRTSILERLSATLCDVVAEQTDSQQVLEFLERANLFVIPLDGQRRWYRYNSLFAEALRTRLEREAAEDISALHLRASQWYEQQGHISEAVQHALQAKAWQRAAALIESCIQTLPWRQGEVPMLLRGELEQANRWAERLMRGERLASPFARECEDVARVRVLLARHQPDEALTILESLIRGATTTGRFDYVIEMRLLEALAHQMRKAEREALSALSQAVRLAEPEGYIRRFVDEGPQMATLLSSLRDQQRRQGPTPYLETVLAAFPQEGATAKSLPQQGLLDPLSERELEVLHLVAQGAPLLGRRAGTTPKSSRSHQ